MVKNLKSLSAQFVLIIAAAGVLGSLFFSEIMGLEPCKACWYQRVALYPIVLFIFIAQLRGEKKFLHFLLPIAGFGWFVSILQVIDQTFGTHWLGLINCSGGVSCTEISWALGGIFTIPLLALIAFTVILTIIIWQVKFQIPKFYKDKLAIALSLVSVLAVSLSLYLTDLTTIQNTVPNWWERIFFFPLLIWNLAYTWTGNKHLLLQSLIFSVLGGGVALFNILNVTLGTGMNELNLSHPVMLSVVSLLGCGAIFSLSLAAWHKAR